MKTSLITRVSSDVHLHEYNHSDKKNNSNNSGNGNNNDSDNSNNNSNNNDSDNSSNSNNNNTVTAITTTISTTPPSTQSIIFNKSPSHQATKSPRSHPVYDRLEPLVFRSWCVRCPPHPQRSRRTRRCLQ